MSNPLAKLEKAIWASAKEVLANPKLKLKDVLEWSSGKITLENLGEVVVLVGTEYGQFNVVVKKEHDKRVRTAP